MKLVVVIAGIVIFLLALISARNLIFYETSFDNSYDYNSNYANTNSNTNQNTNTNQVNTNSQVQTAKLIVNRRGNYEVIPNTLKKDVPVRMEVDLNSVYGCARSVVIPAFNVFKNVRQGDNIIEFIPTKEGRIRIQCSMNMYVGYFDVSSNPDSQNQDSQNQNSQQLANIEIPEINALNDQDNIAPQQGGCGCGCGGRF